jgi:hypothetical protein
VGCKIFIKFKALEIEFNEKELTAFWLRRQKEYPVISKAALLILIPFALTYLCETALKTNIDHAFRNRL